MSKSTGSLPIHQVAESIISGLNSCGRVVLSAPTGSGKSTQVPQILLDQTDLQGEIIVLQPRRLATRMLARRVAEERGVRLGDEVGYQIRLENMTGPQTRIRFVTEAILLRRILNDPGLKGVGALVFDEFHERSLTSDLSLAAAMRSIRTVRPDLRLVVMSATLEIESLEAFLKPCARVESGGRLYPVERHYTGASIGRNVAPVWERAATAFVKATREGIEGNTLIFMPGAYEIHKTITALESLPETKGHTILPLHGALSPEAQDRAVLPGAEPKLIVSTNVAETSITIDGIRLIIDSGLARIARFDTRRAINSLMIEPISRNAAEQRAGRAGRTGPGVCLRLWSASEQEARTPHDSPEIRRIDLSEALLLLAAHGEKDFSGFPWFEAPEPLAVARAEALLKELGAIDSEGRVTERGREMAQLPVHPRFARMLLMGAELGVLSEVSKIAALSQGRAPYRPDRDANVRRTQIIEIEDAADARSDYFVQLKALDYAQSTQFRARDCRQLGIHAAAARQAWENARQLEASADRIRAQKNHCEDRGKAVCQSLLSAFSDQLCLRNDRGTRRCRLAQDRSGELRRESLVETDLFIASEIEERQVRGEATLLLGMATAIEMSWLEAAYPEDFQSARRTFFDSSARRVLALEEHSFRQLVLSQSASEEPDREAAAELLAAQVMSGNLVLRQWDASVENWIQRLNFVALHCPETGISPIKEADRSMLIEQICHGAYSYREIKDRPVLSTIKQWISPEQHYYLDSYAPAEIELPRRKRPVRIRYESDGRAFIASKLQDFYDLPGSRLRIANGCVGLLVELLAPNGRPAHLTDDLDGFWKGAYRHVRKELAGRYPKHEWRPAE